MSVTWAGYSFVHINNKDCMESYCLVIKIFRYDVSLIPNI